MYHFVVNGDWYYLEVRDKELDALQLICAKKDAHTYAETGTLEEGCLNLEIFEVLDIEEEIDSQYIITLEQAKKICEDYLFSEAVIKRLEHALLKAKEEVEEYKHELRYLRREGVW
jgi:hypothetical protein